jgi:hypothetical protein
MIRLDTVIVEQAAAASTEGDKKQDAEQDAQRRAEQGHLNH